MVLFMTTYIGIDVGKKSLQVYLPINDKSFDVDNSQKGFKKLLSYLIKNYYELSSLIIIFEPTGGYEHSLRSFLKKTKINFTTVHPNKVRKYAGAKGLLAKNDNLDSKLLHEYATHFAPAIKEDYSSQAQEELHSLIKRREQIILFKTQEIGRLDTANNSLLKQSLASHIKYLDKQLETINSDIDNICKNNMEVKEKIDRLTSIPGVGITLASKAFCELPELGNIEFSKLTSLFGLAPFARDSGQYRGKRSIFAGRNSLRKVLYMAAVASLRCNAKLKAFYDRLINNGKPPKVALNAVMRKLLAFMNAIVKNNSSWACEE